jgi:hypothetical protein
MLIPAVKFSDIQVVGGSWSGNTPALSGIIKHIIVEAQSTNNQFDFVIIDDLGLEVLRREALVGELNELIELPVAGIYTLKIENATIDEKFTIKFMGER